MTDAAPRHPPPQSEPRLSGDAAARREARRAVHKRLEARAEEQRRSFLRMVSHELRTPLNSILGFSELIGAEIYGPLGAPEYKEYAGLIRDSGQKLLALANQVLEIARLDSGTADLAARREPLDHVLDDVLDGLAEETRARRARVIVDDQGRLPDIIADPKGVRTALTALVSNALAYGPEEGLVTIVVETTAEGVALTLTDQGPGVAAQDIPRLLRPFEQGENALIRRGEGAGLGLPLAYMLCRGMGGGLALGPGPEGGLKVVVRLPAAQTLPDHGI
ncbi:MAG: HAMP domain-containing sensor histidine kinase [Phenylobacterium sp.]|uniref:sensor histidine kinase n=1 Tax=Phenylobacterium sp. TaxID=1871053 RepID=UPI0027357504|nr:HAMP domain-containing sensor histidine kinase [Phenylobacterium sp.]MDP1643419.1 HAMP domain-containing sensor histidine kinase [Phenylobacterium sp.]MDP3116051.1 HAMP domain-containing sensor histidine kinase [Phenylobacterium sp.]